VSPQVYATSLKRLFLGTEIKIKVVDIGRIRSDGKPPYLPLLQREKPVVGFEPAPGPLAELNQKKGPNETYLPYAMGDGRRTRSFLRGVRDDVALPAEPELIDLLHGFPSGPAS